MRTIDQTTDEVLDLARKQFKVPRESLSRPETISSRKLGIDSLQALEMLTRLEQHFGIELPDYEMQGVSDFHTLATRIQARLLASAAHKWQHLARFIHRNPDILMPLCAPRNVPASKCSISARYDSLGAALRDSLDRWPDEICLIEADREREKERLTYGSLRSCASIGRSTCKRADLKPATCRNHHDQSVEMADFRLCNFSRGRSSGPTRLQIIAARTNGAARTFPRKRARRRISNLALDDAVRRIRRASRPNHTRNGSAG